jgi:hypothetical protein
MIQINPTRSIIDIDADGAEVRPDIKVNRDTAYAWDKWQICRFAHMGKLPRPSVARRNRHYPPAGSPRLR